MSSLSAQLLASSSSCRTLPGDENQVQPKAPLLQILHVAGAQEEVFTLKEVMHYLGQYIMGRQLYDKQRQHIVYCQDDPLGELLEVDSFSVKNPSPVYVMLKKYLVVLGSSDAAENLSVGRECVEGGVEDRSQTAAGQCLSMEVEEVRPEALLEPCKLCRVRPRNGNIIHGRTAHLLTCYRCARRLHKFQAPCPGCGQNIQTVIKIFIL